MSQSDDRALRRLGWKLYGPSILVTLTAFVVAYQFVRPAPPDRLVIATGSPSGAYFALARQLAATCAREGFDLEIRETSGSVENLELLETGQVDAGFLQSGVATELPTTKLKGLASLYFEPFWVFVRPNHPAEFLSDFAQGRIGIGPNGSGTQIVARRLLEENGVDGESATLEALAERDAADALRRGELDAALFVAGIRSPVIDGLLRSPGVRLLSLERADAYERRYRYLSRVELPQGVIDLENDLPPEDKELLATAALLVGHEDLHPALVTLLMMASREAVEKGGLLEERGQFPSSRFLDVPQFEEAERFLRDGPSFLLRYLPFWAADLLDRLKVMLLPLLTILFPLAKILPPMYRWRIRRRVYRWYDDLRGVDLVLARAKTAAELEPCLASLEKIEDEILQVEVPPSYGDELFDFRLHLRHVKTRLREKKKRLASEEPRHV